MIFIMTDKNFLEKPKKLYKLREVHIINGSDDDDLGKYTGSDNNFYNELMPNKSTMKPTKGIDIEEKEKKFIKGLGTICALAVAGQLNDPNSNVFIILKKKVYAKFADRILKRFNKIVGVDKGSLFLLYNDFDTMCDWYRNYLDKEIGKNEDKYDKVKYSDKKRKSDKLEDLNEALDRLEDAYDALDRVEARKIFIKEADISKGTIKKMRKFLDENKDTFGNLTFDNAIERYRDD